MIAVSLEMSDEPFFYYVTWDTSPTINARFVSQFFVGEQNPEVLGCFNLKLPGFEYF